MNPTAIDFESNYSATCDIKTLGIYHYLRATKVYLLSVYDGVGSWVGDPRDFNWMKLSGQPLIAHNMRFEQQVLIYLKEIGVIPEEFVYGPQYCTADLSVYCGGPRALDKACWSWLEIKVEKDVRAKMKGVDFYELPEDKKEEVRQYGKIDSIRCRQLWDPLESRWPQWEREVSRINREAAERGVPVDMPLVDAGIAKMHDVKFKAESGIPWSDVEDSKILSPKALAVYCRSQNIPPPTSTAEDSPEYEAWEANYGATIPVVGHLRQWRKANTVLKKLETLKRQTRPNGRFSAELKYGGAGQTMRFSGGAGFNIQNLGRDPFEGVDLRHCFIGNICDLDYSAIEPVVAQWITDGHEMLNALRQGFKIYEAAARANGSWNGPPGVDDLKDNYKDLYQSTKAEVIGLGFGMGWEKYMVSAPLLTDGKFCPTAAQSKAGVNRFRMQNPHIVKTWKLLDRDFKRSVGTDYQIELPSGRIINYWKVLSAGGWTAEKEKGFLRTYAYGGKLFENIVQGIARDILCDALVRLDKAGFKLYFSVHDSAVLDIEDKTGMYAASKIMTTPPAWAPTIPLTVAGYCEKRFRK